MLDWKTIRTFDGEPPVSYGPAQSKRYDPAEPRIPSGPGGGEWTTGGAVAGKVANAVMDYTDLGYIPVNSYLRGEGSEDAAAQAELMKEALRPLETDMTLYRGTTGDAFAFVRGRYGDRGADLMPKLAPLAGKTVTDAAFQSTSVGDHYLGYVGSPVRLMIHAPAGTPAIDVGRLARFKGEREVILGPDTHLRFTNVTHELANGSTGAFTEGVLITAEVVP